MVKRQNNADFIDFEMLEVPESESVEIEEKKDGGR